MKEIIETDNRDSSENNYRNYYESNFLTKESLEELSENIEISVLCKSCDNCKFRVKNQFKCSNTKRREKNLPRKGYCRKWKYEYREDLK